MIKFYLMSIVIWFIMIYGTAWIFEDKIKENGWLDIPKSTKNPYLIAILGSAIPIVRVVFFISVIIMIGMTKEKFDDLKKEYENESN